MIERNIAPEIVDAVKFNLHLKPYTKFILKNGIEVYTIEAGAEDVMSLEWVYYAGNWYEEQNLVAAITNLLLKNGTTKKTAFQINEQMESQKKTIAAAEKKWNELRDKQRDATDKIVRLQADINNWQQEEILQRQDVDKQRVILRELETKRATVQK